MTIADGATSKPPSAIDRDLDRALAAYHREQLTRQAARRAIAAACFVLLIIRVLRVLIPATSAGWLHGPWSTLLVLAAAGCAICRSLILSLRKVHPRDRLRTGIAILRVHHEVRPVQLRIGPIRVTKKVPTVFVDIADGTALSIPRLADDEQLARIEALLRRQHEAQQMRVESCRGCAS
jgi:hypothetical protein